MVYGAIRQIVSTHHSDNFGVHQVILIHPAAPQKPAVGQNCNGCGVCCATEPCPVGMIVSLKRSGTCSALTWSDDDKRYSCGVLTMASTRAGPKWLAAAMSRIARRLIAAGQGCDCSLEPQAR